MDIGYKLHELRVNAGYDAGTFADMVGISKSYVHKLEKSQSVPTVSILRSWISCARPEDGIGLNKDKMERWVELSLSFLFEDGFMDEATPTAQVDLAEQELVVPKLPTLLTRLLPAHFLHRLYVNLTKKG